MINNAMQVERQKYLGVGPYERSTKRQGHAIGFKTKTVDKYAQSASKLADWLEGNIPEGLTVFSFPEDHRRRIRTVNSLERVCLEIRRRARVAGIFPNQASCLRLVSALLMEIGESWETGRIYLSFERY